MDTGVIPKFDFTMQTMEKNRKMGMNFLFKNDLNFFFLSRKHAYIILTPLNPTFI